MVISDKINSVQINECQIYDNKKFGIHLMGQDGQALIQNCKMQRNKGPAIKIGIANLVRVIKNHLKENDQGILI